MAKLPVYNPIGRILDGNDVEEPCRPYLGMSQLGHECNRFLYYYMHNAFTNHFSVQTMRIFERGDIEEARIIKELHSNPHVQVIGTQEEFTDFGNKLKGHCDGRIVGVPTAERTEHILEIKTMQEKYFTVFKKHGMKKAQVKYYIQGQMYMGYARLTRILWIVTNKNTEERRYERGYFHRPTFEKYRERAKKIINADQAPPRVRDDPNYYVCRMCEARDVCYNS